MADLLHYRDGRETFSVSALYDFILYVLGL